MGVYVPATVEASTNAYASVSQGAGFTVTTSWQVLNFDTVVNNPMGIWVPGTGFVIPATGTYVFDVQINGSFAAGQGLQIQASFFAGVAFWGGNTNTGAGVASLNAIMHVTARANSGDIINVNLQSNPGTLSLYSGSNNITRAQLQRLS